MKDKLCCGFCYETEEELKCLMGIDDYLDMEFQNEGTRWIPEDSLSDEEELYLFNSSLGMEVYVKRKAEGYTQKELAKILGIGVETLSKIENGHENLSEKVKQKILSYLDEDNLW